MDGLQGCTSKMSKERHTRLGVEGAELKRVKCRLRLLLMSEKIAPTKDGWKDIRYFRRKIARMQRQRF